MELLSRLEDYEVCVSSNCSAAEYIVSLKSNYVAGRRELLVLKLFEDRPAGKQWNEVYRRTLRVYSSTREIVEVEEELNRLGLPEQLVKFILSKL